MRLCLFRKYVTAVGLNDNEDQTSGNGLRAETILTRVVQNNLSKTALGYMVIWNGLNTYSTKHTASHSTHQKRDRRKSVPIINARCFSITGRCKRYTWNYPMSDVSMSKTINKANPRSS